MSGNHTLNDKSYKMFQNQIERGLLLKACCSMSPDNICVRIKVIGLINSIAFHRARLCAEKLYQHLPLRFSSPQITHMFQLDWKEYIQNMKRLNGGKMWSLERPVAVFVNDNFIGSDIEFLRYINETYTCSLPTESGYYESLITECCKQFMEKSKRKYVYFTFAVEGTVIGSFIFMLYSDLLPLTCQHFLNLCTGYDEVQEIYAKPYYKNRRVHRIVKNGWIQCGETPLSEIDENSAVDIAVIPDERYCIPHDRCGVLSMANDGKHSNGPQFIVCLKPNPWMNYFYVAFGQLIDGHGTLRTLENMSTYYENPIKPITIAYCGEYLFESVSKMEMESKIFLKHQSEPCMEGEDMALDSYDHTFNTYSITSWLDNIVDRIDVRDVPSLLIVEQYLNGLYCVSTDYMPGMDMYVYRRIERSAMDKKGDISGISRIRELLMNFQPDMMTEEEKLHVISEISSIILEYVFNLEKNEFCLRHISMDSRATIQKILEIAHDIALRIITKAGRKTSVIKACADLKIDKVFKQENLECATISEACWLLLQEILNEAILFLMYSDHMQDE